MVVFFRLLGNFWIFSKLPRLPLKVLEVTTEHQKWPLKSTNSKKGTFFVQRAKKVSPRSGLYLLVYSVNATDVNLFLGNVNICTKKDKECRGKKTGWSVIVLAYLQPISSLWDSIRQGLVGRGWTTTNWGTYPGCVLAKITSN